MIIDLAKATETELKAYAYEQLKLLQAVENNIAMIENELAKRQPQGEQQ